jgi:propanediol dehydratase small subunit
VTPRAFSGKPLEDVTVAAAVAGELSGDDFRIHPDTLRTQAAAAERGGNPQLGSNLLRAAELSQFGDDDLLAMYDLLRPGRATEAELRALHSRLAQAGAESVAKLVSEALSTYARRGLLRQ